MEWIGDGWDSPELWKLDQMGEKRMQVIMDHGITSFNELLGRGDAELLRLPHMNRWLLDRWHTQIHAIRSGRFDVDLSYLPSGRGIFYDIETDLVQEKIWLIGVYDEAGDEFRTFVELNPESQGNMRDFLNYIQERKGRLISYSKSSFDKRTLLELISREGIIHPAVDRIEKEIDLGTEIWRGVLGDIDSYSLKSLAGRLGYEFRFPDLDGFGVGAAYESYLRDGKKIDLERMVAYNQDDVMSLPFIIRALEEEAQAEVEIDGYF